MDGDARLVVLATIAVACTLLLVILLVMAIAVLLTGPMPPAE
jgi:hypothetical protein